MIATVEMDRVWDRTAAFVRTHAAALLALGGLTLLLPTFVSGTAAAAAVETTGFVRALLAVVQLVASLVMLWAELAVVALAIAPGELGGAMRRAALRLPVVIGIGLLLAVGALVLALPALGILLAYHVDFVTAAAAGEPVTPSAAPAAWIALYALIVLPLVLWLAARLVLVAPVVLEERRGIGAIARSFALTRGLAARIIGVLLLYGVVTLVLTVAVQFAAGTVFGILFGSDDGLGLASIVTLLLTAVVETGMAVLLWAFIGKLYREACERQDETAAHR